MSKKGVPPSQTMVPLWYRRAGESFGPVLRMSLEVHAPDKTNSSTCCVLLRDNLWIVFGITRWSAIVFRSRRQSKFTIAGRCRWFAEILHWHFSAKSYKQVNGASVSHACEDFWSWNIPNGKLKRESINKNPPCARAEQAYAYVKNLFVRSEILMFWIWTGRSCSAAIILTSLH